MIFSILLFVHSSKPELLIYFFLGQQLFFYLLCHMISVNCLAICFILIRICATHFPGTSHKVHNYRLDKRNFDKRFTNPNFYLKHVICLGNEAEAVEAVCCADRTLKPWLIILPTRRAVQCNQPDCAHICKSAIIASRYRRKTMRSSNTVYKHSIVRNGVSGSKVNFNHFQKKGQENETIRNLNSNLLNNVLKNQTAQLSVPTVILDLLTLCRQINKCGLKKSPELKAMCKTTNMSIYDLLYQINSEKSITNMCSIGANEDKSARHSEYNDSEICNDSTEDITSFSCQATCTDVTSCENDTKFYELDNELNLCTFQLTPSMLDSTGSNSMTEPYEETQFNVTNASGIHLQTTSMSPHIFNGKLFPKLSTEMLTPHKSTTTNFREYILTHGEDFYEPTKRNSKSPLTTMPTCCCQCPKKTGMQLDKKKIKNLLMAVISVPKPCQTLPLKFQIKNNDKETLKEEDTEKEVYKNENAEAPKYIESYKDGPIEEYISHINDIYMHVYGDYKLAEWNYETNMTQYTRQKVMESTMELSQFQRSMSKSLDSLPNIPLKDKNLARQIKLMYMDGINVLPVIQTNEFEQVMYAMQTIYSSATVNKWKGGYEKVGLDPVVSQAMANSNDPEELKYYWSEWRNATGRRIRTLFEQYVSLMNATAKENGFHDASEMWERHYESEDFIDSLSGNWEDVKPLYKELHAYVRHKLHNIYGDIAGAKDTGKILAHFTGDIWSKNWVNLYHRVSPFTKKISLMDTILSLRKKLNSSFQHPDIKSIARTVEKTFKLLGFRKLPDSFWTNSIFERRNDSVMSCEPSAWDMFNGTDLRVKMCVQSSLEDMFTMYHQIAICEYFKEYRNKPFIFKNEAAPGFYEAISGAILLSVKTHSHIKKLNLPHSTPTEESEINQLVNLALDKVAFLPYSYILDLWRHKVFRGEIDFNNYNEKWWELRSRYQGISPSSERTENDFDIGSKLHVATNKPYIKYFVATILQFQIHEALCKKAKYKGQIHKCDFTNSQAAGKTLRKVMGMGASEHWRSALHEISGVRRLESTPLLRYFQPLYHWLKKKNKEAKVIVGWNE